MKILFTGASSFTGLHFVRALHHAGHEVVATFRQSQYQGLRGHRVEQALKYCTPVWETSFGSNAFLEVLEGGSKWDLFCHHGSQVEGYRDPHFDFLGATAANCRNVEKTLELFKASGGGSVLFTSSIFEADVGDGDRPLEAFSAYGLSKTLSWQIFRHFCSRQKLRLGRFVIPNPLGPWEEPRFVSYLCRSWLKGEIPQIRTPDYVRDNIHVSLLAQAYVFMAHELLQGHRLLLQPRGYVESQADFARRVGVELQQRWDLPCPIESLEQIDFSEPMNRFNTDDPLPYCPLWDEKEAWDQLASYYSEPSFVCQS